MYYGSKFYKKSLKTPKGQPESVYRRRTDNTMARRKSTNYDLQNNTQNQRSSHTNLTKNRG